MSPACAMTSRCCEAFGGQFIRGSLVYRQCEKRILALPTEGRQTETARHGGNGFTGLRTWSNTTVVGEVVHRWLWPERAARADTSQILQ